MESDDEDIYNREETENFDEEPNDNADDPDTADFPVEESNEGNQENENETQEKKPVKKRVILNPRPKLDAQRLGGSKGIPILPKLFEKTKFKGKGREKEDLDLMMSMLEHWGHRMFPILTFDALLETIEKLGSKKAVQVCVKKMRMDMPILDDDFVTQREGDEDNNHEDDNIDATVRMGDAFDELVRDHQTTRISSDGDESTSNIHNSQTVQTIITDEVRERMEKNRRMALERRRQRQLQQNESEETADVPDSEPTGEEVTAVQDTQEKISVNLSTAESVNTNEEMFSDNESGSQKMVSSVHTEANQKDTIITDEARQRMERNKQMALERWRKRQNVSQETADVGDVEMSAQDTQDKTSTNLSILTTDNESKSHKEITSLDIEEPSQSDKRKNKTVLSTDILNEDELLEEMWGSI